MNILERARFLVCDMNPHESKKLGMPDKPVTYWPKWARRNFELACDAMAKVREEALNSENK